MKYPRPVDQAAFARRLQQVMQERKLGQVDLAKRVEVTQPTVSFWLNEGVPKPVMSRWIADRLGVPWTWLMYGEGRWAAEETAGSALREEPPVRKNVFAPEVAEVLDRVSLEAMLSYKLGVTDAVARLMLRQIEEEWPPNKEKS